MSRYETSVTGITSDSTTGLIWTRGYIADHRITIDQATPIIAQMNAEKFGGIDTWRVAEVQERFQITDFTKCGPALDTDAFDSEKSGWELTNTKLRNEDGASSSGFVWIVDFGSGYVANHHRSSGAFVRAVSGPSPAGQ